ncbi:MAG: hypothetical protein HGB11_15715, partial [Chlorobiales bacterium]|nr:hypothetical protein [Chlorobiales bacterium]
MTISLQKSLSALCSAVRVLGMFAVIFFCATVSFAISDEELCAGLDGYFDGNQQTKFADPSRKPTKAEAVFISKAQIELFEYPDNGRGVTIVDIDNDGREEILAWSNQGSGRFVYGELFALPDTHLDKAVKLIRKATGIELGVLLAPRFIRFNGVNYVVSTDTGDADGEFISQIRAWKNINVDKRIFHREEAYAHLSTARRLRLALEELGPTFVKMG